MILALFLFLSNIPLHASDNRMAIVWGVPKNLESCQNISVEKSCYEQCLANDSCVLASWNVSNPTICSICYTYIVTSIEKSDYLNGYKVAFKYNQSLPDQQCLTDFENPDISGIVVDNTISSVGYQYYITATNEEWELNYSQPIYRCDDGWVFFQRIKCGWCIKVMTAESISQAAAQENCELYGAILTGLENMVETDYITEMTKSFKLSNSYQVIRVDGTRKPECFPASNCALDFAAFYFNDTWASSQDGYKSANPGKNPEGTLQGNIVEACLVLYSSSPVGIVDDIICDRFWYVVGYACGKPSNF